MTTLADHIDDFLTDRSRRRNWRPQTVRAYRNDPNVAARLLTMPLATITEADLDCVLQDPTVGTSTIHRRAAALNRFFHWATKQQLCTHNPAAEYELPKQDQRLPRPVRSHQDRSALDTAIAAAPQPFRLIFTIIRETGLRANEVLQLNIEDVDLSAGREGLLIRGAKNRVERIQVLASTDMPKSIRGQRAWLRELGPREGHEPLFRSNRGTRLTYSAVYYQWGRLCTKATLLDGDGQPRYTVHQLRHTRGTQMVQDGNALHIVQRALGHKDPRSTQLYADVTEADVRRCHYKRRLVRSRV